jgi:mannose-1-phosphate guanylyltransferase
MHFSVTPGAFDPYFGEEESMATESPTVAAETFSPDSSAQEVERAPAPGGEARLIILAGGDGVRLRSVTRALEGDDRPKQFATLVGKEPLLVQTVRRASLVAPASRTVIVLTRGHEEWYRPILPASDSSGLAIQPENRGTATGILFALLRIAAQTTDAPVVILPSDHWVSSDPVFMLHAQVAVEFVEANPGAVILLGVPPTRAETEYGWIEPGRPIAGARGGIARVSRFIEKPSPDAARDLYAGEVSLWNTSVVVARVEELLVRFAMTQPDLVDAFLENWSSLGSPSEPEALEGLYRKLPIVDFSRDVLQSRPADLSVLAVRGVDWEDLGHPRGIIEARRMRSNGEAIRPRPGPRRARPGRNYRL